MSLLLLIEAGIKILASRKEDRGVDEKTKVGRKRPRRWKKNFRNLNGERKDSSDDLVAVTGRDREREGEREREKETDRDRERNRQR